MKQKTVEILLASYNGEAYIREQIDSILNQTDEDWHLTVSDDGSSDKTPEIVDDYVCRYPDKIARICSGRKFGDARDHFMWLIGQCKAEYIATCDQDDYWYSEKIKKLRGLMQRTESEQGEETPILVFSDQTPTDAKLHPLCDSLMEMQNQYTDEIDWRALIFQNVVTGGACMFNRALAKLACQCKDVSQIIMHDWWLAIVAARFGKVMYLDESTGYYRQHGHNSVGAKDVSSPLHILSKLIHLGLLRKTIVNKKHQAEMFARTYAKELDEMDNMFLASFFRSWSGPLFYWKHRSLIHGFFRLAGMMVLG